MKSNGFNLVICVVWNFYPKSPQWGVVFVSFVISKSCYADFYPIIFDSPNHFNSVRQKVRQVSVCLKTKLRFLKNFPQMHVGIWVECQNPAVSDLPSSLLCSCWRRMVDQLHLTTWCWQVWEKFFSKTNRFLKI